MTMGGLPWIVLTLFLLFLLIGVILAKKDDAP